MKSLNLALAVTAACGVFVSAAPAAVCDNDFASIEEGAQRVARCVPIQAFHQLSVNEDNDDSNAIEPRGGGESPLPWNRQLMAALP